MVSNLAPRRLGAHEILDGVRFRRTLTAASLAALAMTGLSACQTKIGLAASASGHRLSDSDLAKYIKPGAAPYADQSSGAKVTPKLYALENWIDDQLFTDAVTKHGGAPTAQDVTAAKSAVLGSRTSEDYTTFYGGLGYTPSFSDLIINQSTMLVVLVERLGKVNATDAIKILQSGQASAPLLKAVTATKPQVTVSPRYGAWDPAHLSLSADPGAGTPGFVTFPGAATSSDLPSPAA
jgi:hypothetical protein